MVIACWLDFIINAIEGMLELMSHSTETIFLINWLVSYYGTNLNPFLKFISEEA